MNLDSNSFLEIPHASSQTLFIAFAGLQLNQAVPSFHWLRSMDDLPVNKLAVRDVRQMMYQQGVPGAGDSARSVGAFLRRYVAERGFRRVLCIGGSMGGYSALLYGALMGADVVHAFAPLTLLPTRKGMELVRLALVRDWGLLKVNLYLNYDRRLDKSCFDLRRVLAQDNGRTVYHIYYGTGHARDTLHSERLGDLARVILHPYDTAEHHVSTEIRDSGELAKILARDCDQLQQATAWPDSIPRSP